MKKYFIIASILLPVCLLAIYYWPNNESRAISALKKRATEKLIDFENLKTYKHDKYENNKLAFQAVTICGQVKVKTDVADSFMYLKRNFLVNVLTINDGKDLDEDSMHFSDFQIEYREDNFSSYVYETMYKAYCTK
ncbi:hypothetical protein RHO14_08925 [Orbus wheelerorum]|uniref:hypothetical protein n=1 Tax=Orbus wheelerorum TaxID=3074111 RepID=UPI00370D9603